MSGRAHAEPETPGKPPGIGRPTVQGNRPRLRSPWTDSRFWILQLVVLALTLVRLAAVVSYHVLSTTTAYESTTLALFLVPVLLAALFYGLAGGALTAAWIVVLSVPGTVTLVHDGHVSSALAEIGQLVVLCVLGVLLGRRASAEDAFRRAATAAAEDHLEAEALYRNLFDSNRSPILIISPDGDVVDMNAAARRVFGGVSSAEGYERRRLVDVVGADAARVVLTTLVEGQPRRSRPMRVPGAVARTEPVAFDTDEGRRLFRPTATELHGSVGGTGLQVVFEDVTAETQRSDRMEAYAAHVLLGQEEERRRIAQELHDGPVQTLIHLCRQIDAADGRGGASSDASGLAELRLSAEATVAELRRIARGLRPPILDDLGLAASLRQLVHEVGERTGVATSFSDRGRADRLTPTAELALFRIGQEALSNVERHAGATSVSVTLESDASGVVLRIEDDGGGFDAVDAARLERDGSLGLAGMEERAHLVGADLHVTSAPGRGTEVEVRYPAEAAPATGPAEPAERDTSLGDDVPSDDASFIHHSG